MNTYGHRDGRYTIRRPSSPRRSDRRESPCDTKRHKQALGSPDPHVHTRALTHTRQRLSPPRQRRRPPSRTHWPRGHAARPTRPLWADVESRLMKLHELETAGEQTKPALYFRKFYSVGLEIGDVFTAAKDISPTSRRAACGGVIRTGRPDVLYKSSISKKIHFGAQRPIANDRRGILQEFNQTREF